MEQDNGILFESVGTLRYSVGTTYKLIVEVDPEIVRYYRSLIPPWIKTNPQMYAPHISVVRKEIPPVLDFWGKYEGQKLSFHYSNIVYNGTVYWWLNAYSKRLEEIRVELGLPVSTQYTRPPGDYVKCFHITLGNQKPQPSPI
jgi:hypothetical protein